MPENVLFTGEWDASEIAKGVDGIIDSFVRMQAEEKRLQQALTEGEQKLKEQNEQIAKMKATLDSAGSSSKGFTEENKRMAEQLALLTRQNQELTTTIYLQKKQLATASSAVEKMTAAYEQAKKTVEDLQNTTGKPIAPSINDGKIQQQTESIEKNVTEMSAKVSKRAQEARDKLSELITAQEKYKNDASEIRGVIAANNKELNQLDRQLQKLISSGQGASKQASNLRAQIRGVLTNTTEFKEQLTLTGRGLTQTTSAIKVQRVAVKEAEKAGNSFTKGLSNAYSGLRKIAYVIPGLGIAGLISMIAGPLVEAFEKWISSMNEADEKIKLLHLNQANLNDVMESANKQAGKQIADLKILYQAATDVNIPIKERLKAVKELQKEFPDYFGNIRTETILNGDAKQSYDDLTKSIIASAKAKAAKAKIDELETQLLQVAYQRQKINNAVDNENARAKTVDRANTIGGAFNIASGQGATPTINTRESQISTNEARRAAALKPLNENERLLQGEIDFFTGFIGLDNLAKAVETTKPTREKNTKQIENIYQQELQKLKADIAKLDEKGFTNEATITAAVNADFEKRKQALIKAYKKGQLTKEELTKLAGDPDKANVFGGLLGQEYNLVIKKSLADFATQKAQYLKQINDQLTSLQLEEGTKRISIIQDQFDRERQTIESETSSTAAALQAKRDKTIADITKNAAKNGVTPNQLQPQVKAIEDTYSRLLNDLEVIKNQKLQKLSFDTFEKLSQDATQLLNAGNLGISQGSLIKIQDATAQYQAGKISYEKYQKDLTKIARDEANQRFLLEKQFLEQEIAVRQAKLANDKSLTDDQVKQLTNEIISLKQRLADATKGNAVQGAVDTKADGDKKIQELLNYANAIKSVTDSVISFWQQTNEAEQKALDRSIALQDRRVDAARLVAEKGNSEYLRMEEEKQQQLLIKQENAARRQMAINAALQASQLLVAITGAIAKIAEPGVGTVDVIASIGVIVGALAGGYALVRSLQQNQPSFFVGTEDTGTGGDVDDKGGFHAVLHPHERVMTAEENKKLKGLSNKEVIDRVTRVENLKFFTQQLKVKPAPTLNMESMDMAINSGLRREALHFDGIEKELKLNNHLQMKTHRLLKDMGMTWSLDMHGFSVSYMKTVDEINKSKKK